MRQVYSLTDVNNQTLTRTIIGVRNPKHTAEADQIEMEVHFEEMGDEWVHFSARQDDASEYGRDLYAGALRGDYGEVEPFVFPSDVHDRERILADVRGIRKGLLDAVDWVETPSHWNTLSIEKQAEWLTYKQDLRDLPDNVPDNAYIRFDGLEGSLENVTWPEKPE